jgi:Trm5-related predicted tRNA methylase
MELYKGDIFTVYTPRNTYWIYKVLNINKETMDIVQIECSNSFALQDKNGKIIKEVSISKIIHLDPEKYKTKLSTSSLLKRL